MMAGEEKERPPDTDTKGGEMNVKLIHVGVQTTNGCDDVAAKPARRCGCFSVCFLSVIIAILAVGAAVLLKYYEMRNLSQSFLVAQLGEEAYSMFKAYDRDDDGYLSLAEFEPLLTKLDTQHNEVVDFSQFMEDIDPTQEVISVEAHFQPLRQDTMTKDRGGLFGKDLGSLGGLDNWNSTYQEIAGFGVPQFTAFLPDGAIPVGEVYELVKSNLNQFANTLSSNRYFSPKVMGRELLLHRLLSMFHPQPFLHTRFGPQGAMAVVRAESQLYVDVVFRIHAEFQLNKPPDNPFWFTPAQFTGNLIISRDSSHIEHFHLYVPCNRSLNVDMEWMTGPVENENMEVDIGHMPQMELTVPSPSSHIAMYGENGEVLQEAKPPVRDLENNKITWNSQISMEEAVRILELHFYPFKSVPYLPFTEAFQRAAAEEKLVHSILLWGSLDDQSC